MPSTLRPRTISRFLALVVLLGVVVPAVWPASASAQVIDPEGRPVAEILVRGLKNVPEKLVRNQIRIKVGDPYAAMSYARTSSASRISAVSQKSKRKWLRCSRGACSSPTSSRNSRCSSASA